MPPTKVQVETDPDKTAGHQLLPLARIKKMIQADDDTHTCSAHAVYSITIATEQFIQYIVRQSQVAANADKRGKRKNTNTMVTYKDVASAIASNDNLEFLSDVVPKTITFGEYKQKQARQGGTTRKSTGGPTAAGQKTLDQMNKSRKDQDSDVEMGEADDDEANNESLDTGRADDETVSDGGTPPPPARNQRGRKYDPVRNGTSGRSQSTESLYK